MTPAQARKLYDDSASEYDHCVALVDWMNLAKLTFHHNQNETSTTAAGRDSIVRRIMRQKRMGVKKGVVDYYVFDRAPRKPEARGTAIEMKNSKGTTTDEQKKWMRDLRALGWEVGEFHSADDAIRFLVELGFCTGKNQ